MFFLFIGGCAQKISTVDYIYPDWKSRLEQQAQWQVQGKMAFISTEQRQSANLNWQHDEQYSDMVLTSFIGTRILSLKQNAQGAELEYDDNVYTDRDASMLLYRLTGFSIPLDNAAKWLKGTVENDQASYDEQGRLKSLIWQANNGQQWQITYSDYIKQDGYWLPVKLSLKNNKIRIKIQLNDWQLN
ncbi:lipoprotein insertase outer membrane protein LolB [Pseudoalteromonas sp. S4488]|nr:lipoprotein insertase outer membrane protein LolB [Pseudoalteromonas sp. S4488]